MVAYVATRQPPIAIVAVLLGGVGALMLLFVLVRQVEELLPWSLALVGIAYTIAILARGSRVDEGAPLVGVALLLCAELATWSLDERWAIAYHVLSFSAWADPLTGDRLRLSPETRASLNAPDTVADRPRTAFDPARQAAGVVGTVRRRPYYPGIRE